MRRLPLLMLPGLDGTSLLFRAVRVALGDAVGPVCVGFPPDEPLGYRELVDRLQPPDVPYAVLGESFSGPLALLLADRDPNARAVILAAAFVRSPVRLLSWIWPLAQLPLLHAGLLDATARHSLVGEDASAEDLAAVVLAARGLEPRVAAARLRAIARVNVEKELARSSLPMLYLRGRRDRLVGPEVPRRMQALNRRLEVEELDAPHLVLQRAPEESARRIVAFLERSALQPRTLAEADLP